MDEPMTNQNKILEEKVRRQLKEPSENAVAWNMKHYISDVMLQAENGKQEAGSGGEREILQEAQEIQEEAEKETELLPQEPAFQEKEISAEQEVENSRKELDRFKIKEGIENVKYKAIKMGYEVYRQAADGEKEMEKEKTVSFDRKG